MQVLIGLKIVVPNVEKEDMIVYDFFILKKESFRLHSTHYIIK